MKSKGIVSNGLWLLLGHVLWRGSLTIAAILLARSLTPEAFAAYNYFYLTASMLAVYAALGLGTSAARFFAEDGVESPNEDRVRLGTLLSSTLLLSCATFIGVILIPEAWLSAGLAVPQWLLALGVAVMAFEVFPNGAITGIERYRAGAAVSAVSGVALLVAVSLAATRQSHEIAMVALVVSAFIQGAGQLVVVGRAIGLRRLTDGWRLRASDLKRVYGFAGPMVLISILSISGTWLVGRIILDGPGAEHAFALYAIGLQWFSLALVLPNMIARVMLPRLVRTRHLAAESQTRLVRRGASLATLAACGLTLAVALFGPWLIRIYGEQYDAGPWFLAAFTACAVLLAPVNTLGNYILARDGQWVWLGVIACGFVAMVAAAYGGELVGLAAWTGVAAKSMNAIVLMAASLYAAHRLKLL